MNESNIYKWHHYFNKIVAVLEGLLSEMPHIAGSVFPSGCHRHPARLMPVRPALPSLSYSSSSSAAQLLSFRYNLDTTEPCRSENSTLHRLPAHLSQVR